MRKNLKHELIAKWDKKGFKLSEIKNANIRSDTAQLLENTYNRIDEATETRTTDVADFKRVVMPLTRRVFPNLITNDLVAVQPMTGPVGLAYAMRFKYKTEVSALSGTEVAGSAWTAAASAYSGPHLSSAGEILGTTTAASAQIYELGMTVESSAVSANTRKLKAQFSLEVAQDLKAMHGIDIEAEMVDALQYEVAQEIDREMLERMKDRAQTGSNSTFVVSAADGRWEEEKFRVLATKITNDLNNIATRSRRGPGNFIVVSPKVLTALQQLKQFNLAPVDNDLMMELGRALVGTLNGRIKVYLDTFAPEESVICGYKGPAHHDAGIVYCPYIPVMLSRAIDASSFHPVVGVMSRYGIVDNMFNADTFYAYISVNFNGVL